jgi:hypothetical protein
VQLETNQVAGKESDLVSAAISGLYRAGLEVRTAQDFGSIRARLESYLTLLKNPFGFSRWGLNFHDARVSTARWSAVKHSRSLVRRSQGEMYVSIYLITVQFNVLRFHGQR